MRAASGAAFAGVPVGCVPSAADFERCKTCEVQTGRKNSVLRFGRRSCSGDYRLRHGTYYRIGRIFTMIKTFKLTELDCPVCANKMQEAVAKIEGITQARVDFLATKLTIEVQEQDFTKIVKQIVKAVRKVEPDCEIIEI